MDSFKKVPSPKGARMKTTILITLLSAATVAAAQDYRMEGVRGLAGWSAGGFHVNTCYLDWSSTINLDRSQNVTFKELGFECSTRMNFDGHVGNIFADFEIRAVVDPTTLDLNPIPVNNTFRILPFHIESIEVSGYYFNRGFENAFDETFYRVSQAHLELGLDYTNYPDSIGFPNVGSTGATFRPTAPLFLEPHLQLSDISVNYISHLPEELIFRPVPPEPVEGVIGDVNGDDRFDSSDLVLVFQGGEYEDNLSTNSTYQTGDWNGDGEFDSSDLVKAFQAGTYINEAGLVAEVPEPSSLAILLTSILGLGIWKWRKEKEINS